MHRGDSLRERGRDAVSLQEDDGVASSAGLVPVALELLRRLLAYARAVHEKRDGIWGVENLKGFGSEMRHELTGGDLTHAGEGPAGEVPQDGVLVLRRHLDRRGAELELHAPLVHLAPLAPHLQKLTLRDARDVTHDGDHLVRLGALLALALLVLWHVVVRGGGPDRQGVRVGVRDEEPRDGPLVVGVVEGDPPDLSAERLAPHLLLLLRLALGRRRGNVHAAVRIVTPQLHDGSSVLGSRRAAVRGGPSPVLS